MDEEPSGVATGVVLAAGSGRRMGTPKAELVVGGERLMDRAVRLLAEAGCDPVIVVGQAAFFYPAARPETSPEISVWHNEHPETGMRGSLEIAFSRQTRGATMHDDRPTAVMLVDVPGLTAEGTRRVVETWRPGRIAVATVRGRRTHPVVMAPPLWAEAIAMAEPDEGARRFLAAHPELIDEVEVPGDPSDLDTPEDVAAWTARNPGK